MSATFMKFSKDIASAKTKPIERLYIQLNFRKERWLLDRSKNPNKKNTLDYLDTLRNRFIFYRMWTFTFNAEPVEFIHSLFELLQNQPVIKDKKILPTLIGFQLIVRQVSKVPVQKKLIYMICIGWLSQL